MQPIENIMKLRKGYAIKLYEYFNHISKKVDEKILTINTDCEDLLKKENVLWEKMQNKKKLLDDFNLQIESLVESKGVVDKKRASELKEINKKLEEKYFESRDEYQKFIDHVQSEQIIWKNDLQKFLLSNSQKQKIIQKLHDAVSTVFPDLQHHCENWKNEPIARLKIIIKNANTIEKHCADILLNIKRLQTLSMDEEYVVNTKNKEIPEECNLLAKELDSFINNLDYIDILEKTKDIDPFIDEFFKIFKESGFKSLRSSIKLVNNISNTEKKLITIAEHFQHIQIILEELLQRLYTKKGELLKVCSNATVLSQETCQKWLNTHYGDILNLNEKIDKKRNEFLINENIL